MLLDVSSSKVMTTEEIRSKAPSIFTSKPHKDVSVHYTHIPTTQVIEDMKVLGWQVNSVAEVKARKTNGIGFQKHLVTFRNPDIIIESEDDVIFPQILLTNSHDGKNAFTFTAGLFRLVCSNGLVICSKEFENVKLRHMGYSFEELQEKIKMMIKQLPVTVDAMNRMKKFELNESQIQDFAEKAVAIRFKEDELKRINIDFTDLVQPLRKEDEGPNLWNVFNVVQEKFIKGDFEYSVGNKIRKARKIKNFSQDFKVNQELFQLALEYAV